MFGRTLRFSPRIHQGFQTLHEHMKTLDLNANAMHTMIMHTYKHAFELAPPEAKLPLRITFFQNFLISPTFLISPPLSFSLPFLISPSFKLNFSNLSLYISPSIYNLSPFDIIKMGNTKITKYALIKALENCSTNWVYH